MLFYCRSWLTDWRWLSSTSQSNSDRGRRAEWNWQMNNHVPLALCLIFLARSQKKRLHIVKTCAFLLFFRIYEFRAILVTCAHFFPFLSLSRQREHQFSSSFLFFSPLLPSSRRNLSFHYWSGLPVFLLGIKRQATNVTSDCIVVHQTKESKEFDGRGGEGVPMTWWWRIPPHTHTTC